ncbi:hypothetical protein LX15_005974 [Streptoalloteichus tenebrarius]|uniref:DUF6545 domain-containing protein n=1 Tax=Streptoalloteichus tenebrarius (strain ATCC 17920 / DSM 40477 / JCM 4838 / CBS 697.72 / NBRC 16177 / NCIMB 11028 / NRRL B-12390 / A12253. 1 / ISP 5477) TaxID=1933 RepID=A0ABT1I3B2_STRSD|nr:MAB_1171c family putative transporter [Streptoalloteichus tenebrarius]MCP2262240.1 hypothetical protein [Streptoalloteichus tenebrarius]BFF00781.1 hypothetical protein GCM10020241_24560 [Streptoalloteichus tenebrarius]
MVLELVGVASMWLVAFVKAPQALRHPQQRALWLAITTIAVAMSLRLEGVDRVLQGLVGDPHTIDVARQVFATADSAALLCFVLLAAGRARLIMPVLLVSGVVITALLWIDSASPPHARNVVNADPGPSPAYWGLYFAFLFVADFVCAVVCCFHGRQADHRPLRVGLLMFGTGMGLACFLWILFLLYLATESQVALALLSPVTGIEALFLAGGVLVASSAALFRPFVALAALFELRPLWRDITAAVPTVVMVEAHRGVTLLTAPSLRVYRTIIEIRDGLLFLRNYVSPATLEAAREHVVAHGVADDLLDATVTACWLVAALDARRRGEEPQPEPPNLVSQGGTQLDTELHFLRQLSRAYRSPLVRDFARRERVA